MALLRELGLDDRTIVFFCSDNGGVERREGVLDSVGPFRGKKGVPYEGGLRVPMIVRWPGRVPAGAVSSAPWYFADVLPTLAELGGAQLPGGVDGVSVVPTLLGREQPELRTRKLYWEQYSGGGFQQAARWGRWKGHLQPGRDQFELYDLEQDQMEARNVAAAHPEVVRELRAFFTAAHVPSANWHVRPPAEKR
jgi:arylsulfatase A-like enzyme